MRISSYPGVLQGPGVGKRAPTRILALVEAVRVLPGFAAVELEVRRPPFARPVLGGIEQRPAHALGAMLGADGEVLDPAAKPEPDRAHVDVAGAEPQKLAAVLGDEHQAVLSRDRLS